MLLRRLAPIAPLPPAGSRPGRRRGLSRAALVASLLLHLLLLLAWLWAPRPPPPPAMGEAPAYDLVFESPAPSGGADRTAAPPPAGQAQAPEGNAPATRAIPDGMAAPPAPPPLAPPAPEATLPPSPTPVQPPPVSPAPAAQPPAAPVPAPPVPAPPVAPSPTSAPAPQKIQPPAELPAPTAPPAPEKEVRVSPPAPLPPPPLPLPRFVPPAPPLPAPAQHPPPRPRASPPPPQAGTFANPMDLSFGPAPGRAPAPRMGAPRGSVASRSLDLRFSTTARSGPNPADAFGDARARAAGADWMRGLHAYWVAHRYYPRQAAENNEQGDVDLELTVDRRGQVIEARIKGRSGSVFLDMAGLGTWRNARLLPLPSDIAGETYTFGITLHYVIVR